MKKEFSAYIHFSQMLEKRVSQDALRQLSVKKGLIDFCSNDYLGFARSEELRAMIKHEYDRIADHHNGSGGSRLLAGNSEYAEVLEQKIATFHGAESGLIFNSGYDANVGLFSAIAQKGDTIIYDELIHASMHDGIKLSGASAFIFKHNDIEHLKERLSIAEGKVFVAVESIYSMDGDQAPLAQIVELCELHNAHLIVDEAHATGITANCGKGVVQLLGLEDRVFARVHTFGKALGVHGAIVLGVSLLRNFLINFSRSFIYTTALPLHSLVAINCSYELLRKSSPIIEKLRELIKYYNKLIADHNGIDRIESESAIQCVIVPGNSNVKRLANTYLSENFDLRPILSPTVPKGKERLRICIHAYNSKEQVEKLIKILETAVEKE
ncbi:MAG: pyridoxal phosphate-dependent aminotransferase family protein [Bacteroidetes bacterium]|nr:pyridoxal phosphate-dependent aminotransferase family protein [Bacteroidota bacterium]